MISGAAGRRRCPPRGGSIAPASTRPGVGYSAGYRPRRASPAGPEIRAIGERDRHRAGGRSRRHRRDLLGVEGLWQDAERLNLFDPRQFRIASINLSLDQVLNARVCGQACEASVSNVVGARPVGDCVEIDFDNHGEILAAVPEYDGFGNVRARAQRVLDIGGRDCLAAGGDDEVACAIDEPQRTVAPFAYVARA